MHIKNKLLLLCLFISCNSFADTPCRVENRSIFIPRSQGADQARELIAWQTLNYRSCIERSYITTGTTLGYNRSFRPDAISEVLFGSVELEIKNGGAFDINANNLVSSYLGFPDDYVGKIGFKPTIENVVFDNEFFIGLDGRVSGLYLRFNLPLAWTKWDLNYKQVSSKDDIVILPYLSGGYLFGNMQTPWVAQKFISGAQSEFGLADIDMILGYNYELTPFGHWGLFLEIVAPTGNKVNILNVFSPVIGNGKHWELGVGFSGHAVLWQSNETECLSGYIEGNVSHLFSNRQLRTFDLKNRVNSRYFLLEEFNENGKSINQNINAVNFTTRPVYISISYKFDVAATLSYRNCDFALDLGYNFYTNDSETAGCSEFNLGLSPQDRLYKIAGSAPEASFLVPRDFDVNSGLAGATATHKLFLYLGYEPLLDNDFNCIVPYCGICINGEVEGLSCNQKSSLNQFGAFIKFGGAF